jgi:hypothetical protein
MKIYVLSRFALLAVSAASLAWGNSDVYEQRSDGSLWEWVGTPCNGNVCSGWVEVDSGNNTLYAVAGGGALYQMRNDSSIWAYVGPPCTPPSQGLVCKGWVELDNNPYGSTAGIFAGNGVAAPNFQNSLYKVDINGAAWVYNGQPCLNDVYYHCPGWTMVAALPGPDPGPSALYFNASQNGANQFKVYWLAAGGGWWGEVAGGQSVRDKTCATDNSCNWDLIDTTPNGSAPWQKPAQIVVPGLSDVFELRTDGGIWKYLGTGCQDEYPAYDSCKGWQQLDNNPSTSTIVAGTQLYQLHNTHSIWRSTGQPCNGSSCPGWLMLDNNPSTTTISAGFQTVYQQHNTGSIWQYTFKPCNATSCPGWQMIDDKPGSHLIVNGAGYAK